MRASVRLSRRPWRRVAPALTNAVSSSSAWFSVRWKLLVTSFAPAPFC